VAAATREVHLQAHGGGLISPSRPAVAWLALALFTLHNVEEALAFRTYLPRMSSLLPEPFAGIAAQLSYSAMLIALVVVTTLALLVALAVATRPQSSRALWALLTLQAVLALNVVAHVLTALIVFRGYSPGLATAVLVNAPFAIYCFRRAHREQWVSPAALRATVPAALVLHGPILIGGLWLASRVTRSSAASAFLP
jgi:hypothetical protein